MHGELEVRSSVGTGSEFILTVPRASAPLGRVEPVTLSTASSVP